MDATVVSVNVGVPRTTEWHGRQVTSGIWKAPVAGRVAVRGVNLEGDDQADRAVHGGPDKAVYSYAREDYDYWRERAKIDTSPGLFGENLTTAGLDLGATMVGERWRVGSAVLEIAQPRMPCFKLGMRLGDPYFPKKFLAARRPGAYLRIVEEGDIGAGDAIAVESKPSHGLTLRDMLDALHDAAMAAALLTIPRLPAFWHRVATRGGASA